MTFDAGQPGRAVHGDDAVHDAAQRVGEQPSAAFGQDFGRDGAGSAEAVVPAGEVVGGVAVPSRAELGL
ncbi:hypothetical protein [Kitasatospora sp. NPDC087271]|uniref:hypothetical protein n=1 Tax=Kitasatospora sp. NPDC087271 TaxID=3364067 RepID=UPI0037F45CA6